MDEAALIEKLRLVEALYGGATTEGEKEAAERARQRILDRLRTMEDEDPPVEFRFSLGDAWSRKVFLALLRRYGIKPYRYRRQRHTTVMARVSKRFVNETLWPEFQEIDRILRTYLADVTDRVVSQVLHGDVSEAAVVEENYQLEPASTGPAGSENDPKPENDNERERTASEAPGVKQPSGKNKPVKKGRKRNKRKRKRKKNR